MLGGADSDGTIRACGPQRFSTLAIHPASQRE
jgi:hypothetical protein